MKKFVCAILCVLFALITLSSCDKQSKKVVATIDGNEVLYEELYFEIMTIKADEPNITENDLRSKIIDVLKENYAILSLCKEYMPDVNMEDKEIQEAAKTAINEKFVDQDELNSYIDSMYMTEHLLQKKYAIAEMEVQLRSILFNNTKLQDIEKLLAWLDEGHYVQVNKYYFKSSEKTNAQALASFINQGGDMSTNNTEYNFDKKVKTYMFDELGLSSMEESALKSLSSGAKTYYSQVNDEIIVYEKLDNDRDTLISYQLEALLLRYQNQEMEEYIANQVKYLSINWTDFGLSLTFTNIK